MANLEVDSKQIDEIVGSYGSNKDSIISILQDIQSKYRYLPEPALKQVAKSLELPLIQVYGVATFFKAFSLEPQGKHKVCVCQGTACHVRGSNSVLEELERELGIKNGETTEDMNFTLEGVNCLGACALGPIATVNEDYHGQLNGSKVKKMLKKYQSDTGAN